MKNYIAWLIFSILLCFPILSYATFGMVAYDTKTHEYGAILATCVDVYHLLSPNFNATNDVIGIVPNRGITVTQGDVNIGNNINLRNAKNKIAGGTNATDVIQWLRQNDQDNTPNLRQYLILTKSNSGSLDGRAFTGSQLDPFSGSISNNLYSVAGNSLDSSQVLYRMLSGFSDTQGDLKTKLIAALRSVRDSGYGDKRCAENNVSSLSAVIKVGQYNMFYNSPTPRTDAITGLLNLISKQAK